jgi:hypothetical protein
LHRYLQTVSYSLQEALLFNLAGLVLALVLLVFFGVQLRDSFGFILLIESAGLMLVGGALGVAGQATTRKLSQLLTRSKDEPNSLASSDAKAALYALTGLMLFGEGAVMAALFA